MRVTLLNLTDESVSCTTVTGSKGTSLVLTPSLTKTVDLPKRCTKLSILPILLEGSSDTKEKEWPVTSEGLIIPISMPFSASWTSVRVPGQCPWKVYLKRIARAHYRLLILPRRSLSSFLSDMPDRLPLSSLCLPGTHDTMAFYGWPISQCQDPATPLAVQLNSGIRVIDIRLAIVKSRLIAYHGVYPQRTPFKEILGTIYTFLTAPHTSRETIVMSIKQEDFAKNSYIEFSRLVHDEISKGPGGRDMWYLQNRIPTLGEVRGKVVLFSRFGGDGEGWENGLQGLGIHPLVWPDSKKSGFSWQCGDTLVQTHDWYDIPSFLAIPEKVERASRILLPPPNNPPTPTLAISFFSASSFPFAPPPTIATGIGWPQVSLGVEGVNSRFTNWLLNLLGEGDVDADLSEEKVTKKDPRIRGWALLDFYAIPEADLVPLLVECNHRGRKVGEEGW